MASEGISDFRLFTRPQLEDLPKPNWLVEGILPTNGIAVLYGPPSSFKTFLAISIAVSIAAGHNWCGRVTKAGSVLYIATEGLGAFQIRVLAYERTHGISATNSYFSDENFSLLDPRDIERLIQALAKENFKPVLIVLDTLARLIPGADENKAQDMSAAVRAMDKLRQEYSSTILVVHHTGKDGDSERGSSALRGAADVMIKCKAQSERSLSLICNKMKDAEPFKTVAIGLECVKVSEADSSLAVANLRREPKAKTGREEVALKVLAEFGSTGATHKDWLDAYPHSKSTFERAVDDLKEDNAVHWDGERYFARHTNEGVKCQEVSKECHDTSHDGVMSSPPLGDDTDTAAIEQK
ncbi:MAG: AAA family ATPase [Xanthobacteraceae bacterium]